MISCGNCPYLDNCEEDDECPFWEDEDYQIIKKAFDAVVDNEICEDIGEKLVDYVTLKDYVFQEEIEYYETIYSNNDDDARQY